LKFTLSEAAKLRVVISRKLSGLRRGAACVAPTKALKRKHARRCTRTVVAGALTRANEAGGADRLPFSGRIGHRALALGGYTATLTASNANGSSKPVSVSFTIVK
jgi:hypothetical protein